LIEEPLARLDRRSSVASNAGTTLQSIPKILAILFPYAKAAAAGAVPSAALTHGPVGLLCIYPGR
jgi:hypothetical protein